MFYLCAEWLSKKHTKIVTTVDIFDSSVGDEVHVRVNAKVCLTAGYVNEPGGV